MNGWQTLVHILNIDITQHMWSDVFFQHVKCIFVWIQNQSFVTIFLYTETLLLTMLVQFSPMKVQPQLLKLASWLSLIYNHKRYHHVSEASTSKPNLEHCQCLHRNLLGNYQLSTSPSKSALKISCIGGQLEFWRPQAVKTSSWRKMLSSNLNGSFLSLQGSISSQNVVFSWKRLFTYQSGCYCCHRHCCLPCGHLYGAGIINHTLKLKPCKKSLEKIWHITN